MTKDKTELRLSSTLALPLDFVTSTHAILAKKRSGKSYAAQKLAEELLTCHQQVVAIDPTGAWWGLRSSADGRSPGFPIAVLGGEHGDVMLEPTAGEVIANAVVTDRFSCVIDTSLFSVGEEQRFAAAFLSTLYRKNRQPLHLFVDEADVFAPQKPFGEEAKTLGAMQNVVRRGGIRGIGATLITQRPQVLNKDVLSQVDMLTTLRMNHPKDLGAIEVWVSVHGDPVEARKMIVSLPSLPVGEAWIWAPAQDIFERITVARKTTFDSGATPKAGQQVSPPKVLAQVDIAKLGASIASTVEQVKANDPKLLRARVAELEKQLAKPLHGSTDQVDRLEKHILQLHEQHEAEISGLRMQRDQERGRLMAFSAQHAAASAKLRELADELERRPPEIPIPHARSVMVDRSYAKDDPHYAKRTPPPLNGSSVAKSDVSVTERGGLRPSLARLLDIIALLERLNIDGDVSTIAAWYGIAAGRGFTNYLSGLRTLGLLDGLTLTDKGRKLSEKISIPSQEALRERIMKPLPPVLRKTLEIIVKHNGLSIEQLATELGMEPSRGLGNYVSELRTRGLVTKGWPAKASAVLFMKGA